MKEPMFIRSVNTETLIEFINARVANKAEVITYAEMCKALHQEGVDRPRELTSAVRVLLNESQMVFETIRKEGIKLLNGTETCGLSARAVTRTRRIARSTMRKLATVKPDEVDSKVYQSACARTAILISVTDSVLQKKLSAQSTAVKPNQPMTHAQLLKVFS